MATATSTQLCMYPIFRLSFTCRPLLTQRRIYGNEHEVGHGIRDSGVPRGEIFITSKLWNTHHPNAKEGLQKTLDALGTDYLDLYVRMAGTHLIHHRLTRNFS
jgi:hypothetical protein